MKLTLKQRHCQGYKTIQHKQPINSRASNQTVVRSSNKIIKVVIYNCHKTAIYIIKNNKKYTTFEQRSTLKYHWTHKYKFFSKTIYNIIAYLL